MKRKICKGILRVCDIIDLIEEGLVASSILYLPILAQVICELIFLKLGV